MSFNGNLYESDDGLELTTKGQVHTFSTINTALNVSGNNGYLLSENSGTSTGLEWITAPASGMTTNTAFQTWNYATQAGASQTLGANNMGIGQTLAKPSDAHGSKIFRVKKMSWVNGAVVNGSTMIGLALRNQILGGLSILAWGSAQVNTGSNTEQTNVDLTSTLIPLDTDSGWDTYSLVPFIVTDSATQEYVTYAGGTGSGMALSYDIAGWKTNIAQDNIANSSRQICISATFQGYS